MGSCKRLHDVRLGATRAFVCAKHVQSGCTTPATTGPHSPVCTSERATCVIPSYPHSRMRAQGCEVVRMYDTILGKAGFRKGLDLYFERHDGAAVTCDDFLAAMADANGEDLAALGKWCAAAAAAPACLAC
jgi:Peptidase family M1 domain